MLKSVRNICNFLSQYECIFCNTKDILQSHFDVTTTTQNYKDELFKAMITIFEILNKHAPEYHSSQNEALIPHSLKKDSRILSSTAIANDLEKSTGKREKSFSMNSIDNLNKTIKRSHLSWNRRWQNENMKTYNEHKVNYKADKTDNFGEQPFPQRRMKAFIHRRKQQSMRKEESNTSPVNEPAVKSNLKRFKLRFPSDKKKRKGLHSEKLADAFHRIIQSNKHSSDQFPNSSNSDRMNKLMENVYNSTDFIVIKNSRFTINYKDRPEKSNDSAREIITTPSEGKYFTADTIKSFMNEKRKYTENLRHAKILKTVIMSKNSANLPKSTAKTEELKNHSRHISLIFLKGKKKKSETYSQPLEHNLQMKKSNITIGTNNVSIPVTDSFGVLKSIPILKFKQITSNPTLNDNVTLSGYVDNKTDPKLSQKSDDIDEVSRGSRHIVQRNEDITNSSTNQTKVSSPVMNIAREAYSTLATHYIISLTCISMSMFIILLLFTVTIIRRVKYRKSKNNNDIHSAESGCSVFDNDNPKLKSYLKQGKHEKKHSKNKKNTKKYKSNNSFWVSKDNKKDHNIYFSIGSESSSSENEEKEHHNNLNSTNKSLQFTDICRTSPEKQNEPDLQNKCNILKTSENPQKKLLKLHRNLSERTGNVTYTNAVRRKISPPYERIELTQNTAPDKNTAQSPNAMNNEEIIMKSECTKNSFVNSSEAENALPKKAVSIEFSDSDNENPMVKKDFETSNPFYDSAEEDD